VTDSLTFEEAVMLLAKAATPADVFGTGDGAHVYRRLAKLVHPDRVTPADLAVATTAFGRLTALWAATKGTPLTSPQRTYLLGPVFARGDIANLYTATAEDRDVVVKIAREPADNDLLNGEESALRRIAAHPDRRFAAYVPRLVESFAYREPATGVQRAANVMDRAHGFVSLAHVRDAYPGGVDPRDAAWMWRRLLVAIGYAHRAGVIHGAVVPEHVLIEPDQHGLMLVDWCYATSGQPVPALVDRYAGWAPREIVNGDIPGPGTDIHLATKCIVALVGDRMPAQLARFARGCTLTALNARPDDAWKVLAELDDVLHKLYGDRKFRPFVVPDRSKENDHG
jgi:serine/threonine protein kinase